MKKEIKDKLQHIHENLFTGRHSVFIVIGFTVGGTLVGRSIWQYLYNYFGLLATLLVGITIFLLTGFYMHRFYNIEMDAKERREDF